MRVSYQFERLLLAVMVGMAFLAFSCSTTPTLKKDPSITELAKNRDVAGLKNMFKNQEHINDLDNEGFSALHWAAIWNDPDLTRSLLAFGANPDVQDLAGKTPLRYAVDRREPEIAKILVSFNANPFSADASETTPADVCLAAGPDLVAAIFNEKNINRTGKDGKTILHLAADNLMLSEVNMLLAIPSVSVQIKDKADRTALDLALLKPQYKDAAFIAEKLILKDATSSFKEFDWFKYAVNVAKSADYDTVRYGNGNTPLHEAISRQQLGFVDFLLAKSADLKDIINTTTRDAPLHMAVKAGWLAGAELLLKYGAEQDIKDGKGNTPLLLASSLNMTKLLLRYKADPSLKDQDGNTALHKAVKFSYDPMVVEELLKAGTPVNAANLEGDTPLILCVKAGNYQYADALIGAGADLFLKNLAGESPLSLAVSKGIEAVDKIVLTSNVLQRDNIGNSVLATAVGLKGSPEVIALILKKGGDPNAYNNSLDNALHVAVRLNLPAQGILLIQAKADVFAVNSAGETPVFLALAASDGPYDWFFTPAVITARNSNGDTVGHLAARKNLPDGLDYLANKAADRNAFLSAVNSAKESLLHAAVKTDAADATRYLLANGVSPEARDINGDAALNTAVLSGARTCLQVLALLPGIDLEARNYMGEAALHQAVRKQNKDFVGYLVERGAKLEVRDNRGLTPLAVAAKDAQTAIAQFLLKAGAVVDARDYSGSTPLYYAVEAGQMDLVKALVQSGADILAKNAAGDFPLQASLKKGQGVLRDILGGPGADRADAEGRTPLRLLVEARAPAELLKLSIASGADPSSRDKYADTPLHAALRQKDYATAALLLQAKADPFAPNYQGITPVALALQDLTALKDFALAAGLSAADTLGEGFLHYAVRANNAEAVKILLGLGVDKDAKNISGESAKDLALSKGSQDVLALFAP